MEDKKREFLADFTDGEDNFWIYKITFKEPITIGKFSEIMYEAMLKDDRYKSLTNEEFMNKHGIESFIEIYTDYHGFIEPLYE